MTCSTAVIISTYNRPDFLRLVLEGYRQQDTNGFCIYIADDGSGEETADLIRSYQSDFPVEIKHVWHEDKGFRKARIHNVALKEVTEPYVILTDGDCIPLARFVSTHIRVRRPNTLVTGSRILLSQAYTSELLKEGELPDMGLSKLVAHRLRGNVNRIFPFLLSPSLAKETQKLHGVRGCHMSAWRSDLLKADGFEQKFEGWGREDSDLVARILHNGVQRRNLKGMPVLHLWHPEENRNKFAENDQLLEECIRLKRKRAIEGLSNL